MLLKTRSRSLAPKRKKNPKYLAKVRQLPCVVCGAKPPSFAHHIRTGYGMAQKAPDEETLALCYFHHQGRQGIHTIGTKVWQAKYGSEIELLEKVRNALRA